jgi:nucleoside-diphosphate-sugar epimerase
VWQPIESSGSERSVLKAAPVKILITGSAGLIGSEAAMHYAQSGCHVCGIDNNMRKAFFGEGGDTTWNLSRIRESLKNAYEHFEVDIRDAFDGFIREPRCGEVYNIGGGRENSVSILEAIARIEDIGGYKVAWRHVDQARRGDHICYITDLSKLKSHNPSWSVTIGIDQMLTEMIRLEESKGRGSARC